MKLLGKSILVLSLLFVVQFYMAPFLLARYYPISNEAYGLFILSTIAFLSVGFCTVKSRFFHWIIADIVYALLVIFFCTNGSYGIGLAGLSLDGLQPHYSLESAIIGSIVATVAVIIIQLAIKGIMVACKAK